MLTSLPASARPTRRALLGGAATTLAALSLSRTGFAQESVTAPAAAQQFSYDLLTEEMRLAAGQPLPPPEVTEGFLGELTYDDYRKINFRPDRARWSDIPSQFQVSAFHMGWLFKEPVRLFEVVDGAATEMTFNTDDFDYYNDLAARVPDHVSLPGVAGFRINTPLNRLDVFDELVAFLGASYFRALGKDNAYGISARGLALNTASAQAEEFPRFSRFYLERPAGGSVTVHAALEGPSVTGAYRFVITPGIDTVIEVTARLFFRADVTQLGIAPLTSMFLFAEKNRAEFDDYRPAVHDSDGLRIRRADGEVLWRPLNNPAALAGSYFIEENPVAFGLHQRDRRFENYQDTESQYERRPSLEVEPIGPWGKGAIRLVEIPTRLEVNDNIVAFWVPDGPVRAGDAREFAYRLRWGMLVPSDADPLAHVFETRAGTGGVSGIENEAGLRKFVVEFAGGMLADLPEDAEVTPVVTVQNGEVRSATLQRIAANGLWRLVIDVAAQSATTVELTAHVAGYGRKLTEIWLYQWITA